MADSDGTARKHSGLIPFKPGQSGNPAGRPKGVRNKLGEAFLEALHTDFKEHGVSVIENVRVTKPSDYLKVVASILPKELEASEETLDAIGILLGRIDGTTRIIGQTYERGESLQ